MNQLEIHAKEINRPINTGLTKVACLLALINLVIGIVLIFSLNSTNSSVDTINGTLTNNLNWLMNNDTVNLANNISTLNATFNTLQASVASLTEQYNTLNGQVATNTENFNTLNSTVYGSVQNVSETISGIVTNFTTLVGAVNGSLTYAEGNITQLNTNVQALQGQTATFTTDINGLSTTVNTNNASALEIAANVTALQTSVSTIQGQVATAQSEIGYINGNLTYLNTINQHSGSTAPVAGAATLNLVNVTTMTFVSNGVLVCQVGGSFTDTTATSTIQLEAAAAGANVNYFTFPVSVNGTENYAFSGFVYIPVFSNTTYWNVNATSASGWTVPSFSYNCLTVL